MFIDIEIDPFNLKFEPIKLSFITAVNIMVKTLTSGWIKGPIHTLLQKKPPWNAVVIDQNVYA